MAQFALLVAAWLAIGNSQEQNSGSAGIYAKFLSSRLGTFSRHTELIDLPPTQISSTELIDVPATEISSKKSLLDPIYKEPLKIEPATSKIGTARSVNLEELLRNTQDVDSSNAAESVAPEMPTTRAGTHVGATALFASILAGFSVIGVRVRRGALSVLGRKVASDDSARAVELQGSSDPLSVENSTTRRASQGSIMSKIDIPLFLYFMFWFFGNYQYNITNKKVLNFTGGALGFPMVISCLQLGIGSIYALFLWAAPDARKLPRLKIKDVIKLFPLGFCAAGSHAGSVFALSAGAISFGQMVKASEPAFSAVVSENFYGQRMSLAKRLCLVPVIGGVAMASLKELNFAFSALIAACIANVFAAFKANENKEIMKTPGLKERLGSVGNQFAITTILSFFMSIPLVYLNGESFSAFFAFARANPIVQFNLIASSLWFYWYNELATMTMKKTSAVTQSVANTVKCVIVIAGATIAMGESLNPLKIAGCAIGMGGVFLYSIIDDLIRPNRQQQSEGDLPPQRELIDTAWRPSKQSLPLSPQVAIVDTTPKEKELLDAWRGCRESSKGGEAAFYAGMHEACVGL
jgi:solute carrier family 35 protein E1